MPAERGEMLDAKTEAGYEPLGWVVRVSDGDIIGFEAYGDLPLALELEAAVQYAEEPDGRYRG
jgi:hypothetical protein